MCIDLYFTYAYIFAFCTSCIFLIAKAQYKDKSAEAIYKNKSAVHYKAPTLAKSAGRR